MATGRRGTGRHLAERDEPVVPKMITSREVVK